MSGRFAMINPRSMLLLMSMLVSAAPMTGYGLAMQALSDDEMEDVSGAGIAVALENFRFMMAPTSYMEQVGVTPAGAAACTGSGSIGSNTNCWRRGDLRWYGINLSGAGIGGSHWNEAGCNAGSLNCPRGGVIGGAGGWFSPFDNPYLMRAWSPQGMAYNGSLVNTDPNNPEKTIYEYLAPTSQPDYTMSFWGEIEAGATRNPALQALGSGSGVANGGALLKSQTIIRGNAAGSVFRLFKLTDNPLYGETFAMFYHSRLRGDFRFSVAQSPSASSDVIGQPVVFANDEGLHFYNVDAYLPIGQLYYQALVLNAVGTAGNFSLTLTRVPNNNAVVYDRFYGLNSGDTRGFETARLAVRDWNSGCGVNQNCINYRLSHGHVRYGDWFPTPLGGAAAPGTRNAINNSNDGILPRLYNLCTIQRIRPSAYGHRQTR
ncbi:MAG: hypothetical protein V2I38_07900 [Alcanivoracaceae bacterium]|jgi:hypothetical protein|nr:hypothetical protein [Alcanivoracaceae bacterium]